MSKNMKHNLFTIFIASIIACNFACAAPVNFIGKSKNEIRKESSLLEHEILYGVSQNAESFRYTVRNFIMGCLMAASAEPYIKGTLITPDTRYGDIATIFISDVAYCGTSLRDMGEQLRKTDMLGEAVVVKESVVMLNDLDFLSSPDTQITTAIQGCIDLGSLCYYVGNFECSQRAFAKAANIMTSNNVENEDLSDLITKVAASQYRAGNYSDAFESYQTALKFMKKLGSTNKEKLGIIASSAAAALFQQRKYMDAETAYRSTLITLKSVPHKNFKLIADTTKSLASCLFAQRMWLESVTYYEEALSIYVSLINDTDDDPLNDTSEFTNILNTVILALDNAAAEAAKGSNYLDAHALRERAAKVNEMWSAQGHVDHVNNGFLKKMFKDKQYGAPKIKSSNEFFGNILVWAFRFVFAGVVAMIVYLVVSQFDRSKSFSLQVEHMKSKIMQRLSSLVASNAHKEVAGSSWSSVPTPEERNLKIENWGNREKNFTSKIPSPGRQTLAAVQGQKNSTASTVAPARKEVPMCVPSE
jgi:tetratricopeptide (TPR) repeat protein